MSENEAYVDPDNVDALLASELNEMTLNERETLYEEIHGVEQQREESEEFLENSLRAMDDALRQLPDRQVYEKAANINPEYVEDRAFRLMFLRSENFEAVLAARRLVKFLEGKVRFFGEDTLARPIYLSDFNDDDMAFFKSGIIQTIPSRDRSGRPIFADFNMNPNVGQPKHVDSYLRAVVYTVCAAAEDEETQKRGLVGIFYFTSALQTMRAIHERGDIVFDWLPIKIVGGHFCFNDPRFRLVKALSMLVVGRKQRLHMRIHEGSHTECQYKLMTFGVPVEHFPVTYEGELKTSNHLKWLARRKLKEKDIQSLGKFEGVDLPCTYDILLGRGKSIQNHSGNILMRNLIWHYIPIYRSATKKGKVVWTVLHATKATGARFLERQTNGWWVEVSDEVARAKVSMSFRTSFTASLPTVNMRQQIYHQKISLKMEERDSKRAKCQDHRVGVHDDQDEPRGVDNCFAMLPWMPFQRHG